MELENLKLLLPKAKKIVYDNKDELFIHINDVIVRVDLIKVYVSTKNENLEEYVSSFTIKCDNDLNYYDFMNRMYTTYLVAKELLPNWVWLWEKDDYEYYLGGY